MRLSSLVPAAAATLVLAAAPAHAAGPVPGAHYDGTTDTGTPFGFDVSPDGATITNVLTSAPLTCVGPEPGVEILAIASKTPFAVAGGAISGKDDAADPRLEMTGTFTSATEASGKLQALTTKFKIGEGVTSCIREVTWTARTTAAAPKAGDPAPGAPATQPQPAPQTQTATAALALGTARAKLGRSVVVALSGPAPAAGTAQLLLSAKDARRYRVSRVLGRAKVAAGVSSIRFRPSARTLKRLRRAKRLAATVRLGSATVGSLRLAR